MRHDQKSSIIQAIETLLDLVKNDRIPAVAIAAILQTETSDAVITSAITTVYSDGKEDDSLLYAYKQVEEDLAEAKTDAGTMN